MKKSMIPILLAFLAGLLAVAGAIYQYQEKQEADRKADINQGKADTANAKLLLSQEAMIEEQRKTSESQNLIIKEQQKANLLAEELAEANRKIIDLNEKVNVKSDNIILSNEKLIAAQNETIKQVLGDGYPIFNLVPKDGKISFVIENISNYSLHDGHIEFIDASKLSGACILRSTDTTIEYKASCFENAVLGRMDKSFTPNSHLKIQADLDPNKMPVTLIVTMKFRHGTFFQYFFFHLMGDDMSLGGNKKAVTMWQLYRVDDDNRFTLISQKNNTQADFSELAKFMPVKKMFYLIHGQ